MATKTENLRQAYMDIKAGKTINCNGCKIWYDYSEHGRRHYIFWLYYGSSAEKPSLTNLKWIMSNIANSDDFSYTVEN